MSIIAARGCKRAGGCKMLQDCHTHHASQTTIQHNTTQYNTVQHSTPYFPRPFCTAHRSSPLPRMISPNFAIFCLTIRRLPRTALTVDRWSTGITLCEGGRRGGGREGGEGRRDRQTDGRQIADDQADRDRDRETERNRRNIHSLEYMVYHTRSHWLHGVLPFFTHELIG